MSYIAESYDRGFRDAFGDYLAIAQDFFVSGCVITETPSGSSTTYSITDGSACFKGEFLRVDAHSINKLASQVVYLELYEDAVDLFPVLNVDGSSDNVMIRRRMRLAVGPVYPVGHMSITAPRKEALDRLRFRGRLVLPGMILPYHGTLDHFSGTGLGIPGGPMDGWAICNGLNGTVDMRGLVPSGATEVPASGAPTMFGGVGASTSPGDAVGQDLKQIQLNQLPPHSHEFTEKEVLYVGTGGTHNLPNAGQDYNMAHDADRATESQATTHDSFDSRQASRALVFIQSIAT